MSDKARDWVEPVRPPGPPASWRGGVYVDGVHEDDMTDAERSAAGLPPRPAPSAPEPLAPSGTLTEGDGPEDLSDV